MKFVMLFIMLILSDSINASTSEDIIKGGKIMGKVFTSDHQPAEEVAVYLMARKYTYMSVTNEEGFFEFTNIPEGKYQLKLTAVGNEIITKDLNIDKHSKLTLQFQLQLKNSELDAVVVASRQKRFQIGRMAILDKDLPISVGLIPNKVIQDQQVLRLGELVKNVPGVSLVQTRFGVNETYSARGYTIGVNGGAGGGSIFKNGMPVNIAGVPEAATLESVEIIKGSSAFLFGSSSSGLVINMINKKPKFESGGSVQLQTGSYNLLKPIVDIFGPISNKVAYRVVGSYEKANSFRDQIQSTRNYFNPSLLFNLSDKSSLLLQHEIMNAQLTPDLGIGTLDSGRIIATSVPRSRFQNVQWAYNHVNQNSTSAIFKHQFNEKLVLHVSSMYQSVDVDSYGAGNLNTANKLGVVARNLARAHSVEEVYAGQFSMEGKYKWLTFDQHVIVGMDYTSIKTQSDGFSILNQNGTILRTYDTINFINPIQFIPKTYIPPVFLVQKTLAPSNRAGFYLQNLISLNQYMKIFVGARYSYQANIRTRIDSMATVSRNAISVKGTAPTAEYLVLSPKAGLILQPNPQHSFYVSYANNFTANTGTDVAGNVLPASIIDQYEIGTKHTFYQGRFTFNTAIYKIVNSHLAQQAPFKLDGMTPNNDPTIKQLSGETTSNGFEMGFNGTLSKNCYFISGYSYNDIKFTNTNDTKGSNIEGETLVNAPKNTANLSIFYTIDRNVFKGLKWGLSGFYIGERFGGYNNIIGQSFLGSRLLPLTPYFTLDAFIGYTKNKFSTNIKLSNIFNEMNYLVHDNYSVNPIAPRQIMFSFKYDL